MVPRIEPKSVRLRFYQVGFGDCTLLSFNYPTSTNLGIRHILIDFGTSALPKWKGRKSTMDIANAIKEDCGGKLDAIVVTHRHSDHMSGFAGKSGNVIKSLKPKLVVQPWTEDPEAAEESRSPETRSTNKSLYLRSLDDMHTIAQNALNEVKKGGASFFKTSQNQLSFLGEVNLKNAKAVKNLMNMENCKHTYVYHGSDSGLGSLLPGVKIHVLGPPTLEQSSKIEAQREKDPTEYWHLQSLAWRRSKTTQSRLFKSAKVSRSTALPFETRWFLPRIKKIRGDELLEIVRILDDYLNNTSVILLFEIGNKKLLFPGDAQIENWRYTLEKAKNNKNLRGILEDVDFYKVGHHGSLNATPKSLWNMFNKKGEKDKEERLRTVVSTKGEKHGDPNRNTEVPRRKLVEVLKKESEFFTTQDLRGKTYYKDFVIDI